MSSSDLHLSYIAEFVSCEVLDSNGVGGWEGGCVWVCVRACVRACFLFCFCFVLKKYFSLSQLSV